MHNPLTKEERIALATRVRLGEIHEDTCMACEVRWVGDYHRYVAVVLGVEIGHYTIDDTNTDKHIRLWGCGYKQRHITEFEAACLEYLERDG